MLDSLVRVSRRAWWEHLYSGSRGLQVRTNMSCTLAIRNLKQVPNYKISATLHARRTAEPSPLFPASQQRSFTLKYQEPKQPYQNQVFSFSRNASRGPSRYSAPIPTSKPIRAALTLAPHRPSADLGWDTHRTRHCSHQLPFQRFHALFHSLFKVLFIFPSRYLFAIGLVPIFSFRWSIPPTLGCTLKQPDSTKGHHKRRKRQPWTGLAPSSAAYSKAFRSPPTRTLPL